MNTQNDKVRILFYHSLLPWKGDSKKQIFYKVIFLAAVCVFLVCAALLINDLVIQPKLSDKKQQDIKNIYYKKSSSSAASESLSSEAGVSSTPSERDAQNQLVRFVALQKINSDIVGWIKVFSPLMILDRVHPSSI